MQCMLAWAPGYFILTLTWSWVYFSTAAGVPESGVGSRWLECLTPNSQASLFSGSMLPRLHFFMSALTHSDQVFLRLPLLLALGIVILVMEFMHEEECATCPYHLKRLVRRAAVTINKRAAMAFEMVKIDILKLIVLNLHHKLYEPGHEKTWLRGFWKSEIQTS